ncbi:hypothetical protein THRCLA_06535 [Thraustotheca clavata]|uniref:PH domain-containing protein n=1 Tax=Thraustotheca clavata TaxID=74557 RepID=A0A1V9ZN51_9STRA|nr:hypothetical protein THRCLA_06535 [Thraustotheca clavata]
MRGTLLEWKHNAWHARLFEIDENVLVRTLTYYDVHNKAQGHIVLTGMDAWIRVQESEKQPHSFVLKTKQTCVWLAATSDAMMWKWIDFLVLHHCASLDELDRKSLIARESMFSMSEASESLVEHRESTLDRNQVRRIASQNDLYQIGIEIEHQMIENIGMTKLALPTDTALSQCHVFVSDHWQNVSKIVLLIGNSNSRIPPGIWSRHECNSLGIERGSMLPYISNAIDNGYGVMVLDMGTHFNTFINGSTPVKVPVVKGSSTPEEHIHFVWTQLLPSTRAHDIVAIAYGLGGVSLNDFLLSYPKAIADDAPYVLKSIAFLQSFHNGAEGSMGRFLRTRSMKWDCHPSIPFNQPMATPVPFKYQNQNEESVDSWCLSVGPDEDNLFSNVMENVFDFLDFCIDVDDQLNICTDRWISLNCT